jgi:uncharacterized protein
MRLTPEQRRAIVAATADLAGVDARVRLFGSRLHDELSGGDIDLLVECPHRVARPVHLAAQITARLQRCLGDRKIDVQVLAPRPRSNRCAARRGPKACCCRPEVAAMVDGTYKPLAVLRAPFALEAQLQQATDMPIPRPTLRTRTMRLRVAQTRATVDCARQQFSRDAQMMLFGCRPDDAAQAGDVDLPAETTAQVTLRRPAPVTVELEETLGLPVAIVALQRGTPGSAFARIARSRAQPLESAE